MSIGGTCSSACQRAGTYCTATLFPLRRNIIHDSARETSGYRGSEGSVMCSLPNLATCQVNRRNKGTQPTSHVRRIHHSQEIVSYMRENGQCRGKGTRQNAPGAPERLVIGLLHVVSRVGHHLRGGGTCGVPSLPLLLLQPLPL